MAEVYFKKNRVSNKKNHFSLGNGFVTKLIFLNKNLESISSF
ncbi:hypothetical protein [Methylomonas albis]|nr:hypothetical protein [Methylomonas albis]